MKYIGRFIMWATALLLLWNCSTYKARMQEALLSFPDLGALVKAKDNLLYSAVEQVGVPDWPVLSVGVQQLPFNKVSYALYTKYMQRAGKINSIAYNDSLPYKPKYLRLQLLDKLELTQMLNKDENEKLRSFVANDDAYKVITSLDITVPETEMPTFTHAEVLQLQRDEFGNNILVAISGDFQKQYFFSELQVFGYHYDNFCWGEDRYHNLIIENLVSEGEKCPKGTYLKASKVEEDRAYLKF